MGVAATVCDGLCAWCGARIPEAVYRTNGKPVPRLYCQRPKRCRQYAYEHRHGIPPGQSRYPAGRASTGRTDAA